MSKRTSANWTDEDRQRIIRMRHAGFTWREIAAVFGRPVKTVEWFGIMCLGVLSRKQFEELKATLAPDLTNGPRPGIGDFMQIGMEGRGWGRFLDDES